MRFSTRQIVVIGVIAGVVLIVLFLIFSNIKSGTGGSIGPNTKRTNVVVWGVDPSGYLRGGFDAFEKIHKNDGVHVEYQQHEESQIENDFVNSLAVGDGPDVIMVKNRSLWLEKDKLQSMPSSMLSLSQIQSLFPTVVAQDFYDSASGRMYALPLYVDTLAFAYNKDKFDAAGIITPPETWEEFMADIPKLRASDDKGNISEAAAAIGGSDNTVENGSDLLLLLMMQNGAKLADQPGTVNFDSQGAGGKAFDFYLQFANPQSSVYTWNGTMKPSLDAFALGRVAMIPVYRDQIKLLKDKNPYVSYGIGPMPQPAGAHGVINYANYWGLGVSRQSKQAALAWQLIAYLTYQPQIASQYSAASDRPPALKSLLAAQYEDVEMGVFARQALTARSWPGPGDDKVRPALSRAVEMYLSGGVSDVATALDRAQVEVMSVQ